MKSYIPTSEKGKEALKQAVGISSALELFEDIPEAAMLKQPLDIQSMGEVELTRLFQDLANENITGVPIFLGAGAYHHYIPATVKHVTSRSEFFTAYTPYQAEISQGLLQATFEYQSMICNLTGMEVANASVYDGATACAEAMSMASNISRKKNAFAVSSAMHPDVLTVLQTYADTLDVELRLIPTKDGVTDIENNLHLLENTTGFLFSQPNFYGCLEDVEALSQAALDAKALRVAMVNPISLGLLKKPNAYADIVVGEGQPLGSSLSFGGPYLGFMATTTKYMRNMPGRIVGQSQDKDGNIGYLLTLQAREQHIRRERATSNICSNQALNALAAAVYLATLGDAGLTATANACYHHAEKLKAEILKIDGFHLAFSHPTFMEFVIQTPVDVETINNALLENNIIGGLDLAPYGLKNSMLICCTETTAQKDIDAFIKVLKEVAV